VRSGKHKLYDRTLVEGETKMGLKTGKGKHDGALKAVQRLAEMSRNEAWRFQRRF
jgi:hypothetical protein